MSEPLLVFDPQPVHILLLVFGLFTIVFATFGRVLKVSAKQLVQGNNHSEVGVGHELRQECPSSSAPGVRHKLAALAAAASRHIYCG